MAKITLNDVGNLIDATTARTTINDNSANIRTAFENTLSRDGTSPNTMQTELDMNSFQVLNLSQPATADSPLRLQDLNAFIGGGSVTNIPAGGTTNQILSKNSNTNYDVAWKNGLLSASSPLNTLTVSTVAGAISADINLAHANTWTGQQAFVAPVLGTPASGVLTNTTGLPISTGVSGLGTGVATALGIALGNSGAVVIFNSSLGTPSTGVLTNCTGLPVSTGISGLAANVATFLATPTSANLASALTDETGTGANVFAQSPQLITPLLGTPTSGTLTNCTGLPVSTGVSGFGAGITTFLATPTSANLATALTDETGTGANVFANTPTLVTPLLGTPTSGVLTNCTGLPVSTGISGFAANVATFLATPSSANLAAAMTDETGTGANVFANTPTLVTPLLGTPTSGVLTNCTGLPISTGVSGLAANVATFLATPSSANLSTALTDKTGTGVNVFGTAPTFTTSIVAPLVIGGGAVSSTLILESTSGAGSSDAIQFKTASQSLRFTIASNGKATFGPVAPGSAFLDINQNASNVAGNVTAPLLRIVNVDASDTEMEMVSNGSVNGNRIAGSVSSGTLASPTAVASGKLMFNLVGYGYDGSTYAGSSAIQIFTTETFSGTAHGSRIDFSTTPATTTSFALAARMHGSGGFSVFTTSDPGAGMIYTNAAAFMIRTKTSYTNGAAAGAGTITNAPAAGNPTKWIPVDDNGTTRYIPAW